MDHGVDAKWRNVAAHPGAMAFVSENGGRVPQVRVGSGVLIDPLWADLAPLLGRDPTEGCQPLAPRPYASADGCPPAPLPRFE